jgi:hypothetical protein
MSVIGRDTNKALLLKTFRERITDDLASRLKDNIEYIVNNNGELPKAM